MNGALIRAVTHSGLNLPQWPNPSGTGPSTVAAWLDWLRQVWATESVSDAIGHASPRLAEQIRALCATDNPGERETRRAVLSVVRYLGRMTGRPTPNGLFAGVAPARFAHQADLRWGTAHEAVARSESGWLAEIISQLERQPDVLPNLLVVANTTVMVRGDRLVVPYRPSILDRGTGAVEVSLRYTAPVRVALHAARTPIRFEALCTKVQTDFPHAPSATVTAMLTELVTQGVLVTGLHAPSTEPDALGHLLRELEAAGEAAAKQSASLRETHTLLQQHQRASLDASRAVRAEAATQMHRLARRNRHPVAVDLWLDAEIVLPDAIAHEAERAAMLLTRLSPYPHGTPQWGDYHRRFYERFGAGTLVPLLELVADNGIGWPDGYPGASAALPRPQRTRRDEALLALAQSAALDGRVEVILDEVLLAELDPTDTRPARLPSHLELCARVDATSEQALGRGDFRMTVTSVSRAAGVVTGRFLHLLTADKRDALTSALVDMPSEDDVLFAQLSFPPLDPATAHVTRTTQVLPTVISLAEHRNTASANVLTAQDLAVGCDSHRLYLTAPALGRRVEAWGMHALNLRKHTPPLARLVTELCRAQSAQVIEFDWGAASTLPFLPRLRSGRIVLAAARWRLTATDLPGRSASWEAWVTGLADWQGRRRLPRRVYLVDGDWRLPLDLDEDAHRMLLREHLATRPHAVLEEGPAEDATGWFGGRAHEIVVPLAARQPQTTTRPPRPTPQRIVRPREHGLSPGASPLLFAKLYGDAQRQNVVLAEHLPALLAEWGEDQPRWWFLRFREGGEHYLRLRIALPSSEAAVFGEAAGRISTWTDRLRRLGLLREVAFATSYPETGRWGSGPALAAAEAVFTADSRAVLAQLAQPARPHHHALAAANFAAIAIAFTGGTEAGMHWLIDHVPAKPPTVVPRPVFAEARRLADPREDFHVLRGAPGGAAIVATWAERAQALAAYRAHLSGADTEGLDPDTALDSLLHTHFLRSCGVEFEDKAVCLYLARTAALTFAARAGGPR
ncbi:thiopeptide-type bacteriocin biosynthesis domain-containing protein [Saccharopolyspora antimicrobica]|uniref:Thiopeptide-type bacteriocin biosynthesis domain-containing protein n=2 Tax=Saccharopolyspora antimicrobica TaxID=455193 RepID=A0A1I5AUE2_9PSEU|nr:thiopeptide-type bacteriocin biosynthesis protein [Saccharopolyspora antimicrobica]SFN66057.1 thiopeptide-type bacteriocin biosynthesis domain-containing protein [Saccharopolyspora antimicrobica]